ncbi:MAG: hypothetical protein ACPGXK_02740 [Phycisphaerae bacterium]
MSVLHHHDSPRFSSQDVLCWLAHGLLFLWLAFWVWFNIASAFSEDDGQFWHLGFAGVQVALVAAIFRWPGVGGIAMILFGAAAAILFPNPGALFMLAVPAIVIGAMQWLIVSRSHERRE